MPMMNQDRRQTIAVTGANGWIGARFCTMAEARGHRVRPVRRESLLATSASAQALAGCDYLVHLAALVHQSNAAVSPDDYQQANVELTRRLAKAAGDAGIQRFVLVSSVKVAGERTAGPVDENQPPDPSDDYARSKLQAERLLLNAEQPWPFEVVIARPPLVYGPGVRANFRVLLRAAESRLPLPLAGAQAPRSMIYLDNLVDALLFLCEAPGAAGQILFVSDGRDLTVADLIRAIRANRQRPARLFAIPEALLRLLAQAARIVGVGSGSAGIDRLFNPLQISIDAIRKLGWTPPVGFEQALAETLNESKKS